VSPLTIDYINPEAPGPHLAALEAATAAAGGRLRERLAIYPEYIHRPGFVPGSLRDRVVASVDSAGLVPDRGAPVAL
jgi:FO synthase